jgi:hypothetical protein
MLAAYLLVSAILVSCEAFVLPNLTPAVPAKSSSLHPLSIRRNIVKWAVSTQGNNDETNGNLAITRVNSGVLPAPAESNFIKKIRNLFRDKRFDSKSMAKLGGYVVLSYGFVSNISYITCVIISWVLHGKKTGLSPLAPGQWKSFLGIYAGLWAILNLIRPLRFSLSVLISPLFDKFINFIQGKTGFKRASCVGITVFLVNIVGTCSYLVFGLLLATTIAKVPLL